jgi:hypothetical protein
MDEGMGQCGNGANREVARLFTKGASALAGEAIGYALAYPFELTVNAEEPLVSAGGAGGSWEWAVFSSCPPGKSLRATEQALRRAVRAARKLDETKYSDDWLLETSGLKAESGPWPHAGGSWEYGISFPEDGYGGADQSYRLVLCSPKTVVGFCSVTTTATYSIEDAAPDLIVRIGAVFVDPVYRGRGLSSMLAEGAAFVALEMVRQLQDRLVKLQVRSTYDVELQVHGEANSDGGHRFLAEVMEWLERLTEMEPLVSEGGEAVLCINNFGLYDV